MHATLCEHLLDLVQNAVEAGASFVQVEVVETEAGDVEVTVSDNGRGMTPEEARRALDPFASDGRKHPARRVGLGLPFFRQMVEQAGGEFDLRSELGVGTSVFGRYRGDHPDAPPMGEWSDFVVQALVLGEGLEMALIREWRGRRVVIRRSELAEALALARRYVGEQEREILGKG